MTREAKKDREATILRMVYGEHELDSIDQGERPDFSCSPKESNVRFGIEVTELYASDSAARLKNIKGYVRDILSEGRHRHRLDRSELRAESITASAVDGSGSRTLPAIFLDLPNTEEHLELVASRVREKAKKARGYRDLNHINLIILDQIDRWGTFTRERVCGVMASSRLRPALWQCPFREVYYLTKILEEGWICVHLLAQVLLAETRALFEVVAPTVEDQRNLRGRLAADLFWHLNRKSPARVRFRCGSGFHETIHRRFGIVIPQNGPFSVRDYGDGAAGVGGGRQLPEESATLSPRQVGQRIRRWNEISRVFYPVSFSAKVPPPN